MARLYSLGRGDDARLGIGAGDAVFDLAAACKKMGKPAPPPSMLALLQAWPSWKKSIPKIAEYASANAEKLKPVDTRRTKIQAPIPRPPKIFCLAFNNKLSERFLDRFRKVGNPGWFMKSPTCVVGPGADVELPPEGWANVTTPEVELGVVVGKKARWIGKDDARSVIAGYMVFNDVTAQDLLVDTEASISPERYFSRKLIPDLGDTWEKDQLSGPNRIEMKQWDSFAPCGPCLVTADEIPDPYSMDYVCKMNNETVMQGSRVELIWSIEEMVHKFSLISTLEPGDVLSSGNLGKLSPRAVLKPGDEMELRIGGLGTLRNKCVASRYPSAW